MGRNPSLIRPLAVLLVLCAAAFLFIEIADEVREGATQRIDDRVLRSLRTPGNPADDFMTQDHRETWWRCSALDLIQFGVANPTG